MSPRCRDSSSLDTCFNYEPAKRDLLCFLALFLFGFTTINNEALRSSTPPPPHAVSDRYELNVIYERERQLVLPEHDIISLRVQMCTCVSPSPRARNIQRVMREKSAAASRRRRRLGVLSVSFPRRRPSAFKPPRPRLL